MFLISWLMWSRRALDAPLVDLGETMIIQVRRGKQGKESRCPKEREKLWKASFGDSCALLLLLREASEFESVI